jgi:signal transduction histidine kinase
MYSAFELNGSENNVNDILSNFSIQTHTTNTILNYKKPVIFKEQLITLVVETEHGTVTLYALPDLQNQFVLNDPIFFQGLKHMSENIYFPTMIAINGQEVLGKTINSYDNQLIKEHLVSSQVDNFDLYFLYDVSGTIKSIIEPIQELSLENEMVVKELIQLPSTLQKPDKLKELKINDTVKGIYYTHHDKQGHRVILMTDLVIDQHSYSLLTVYSLNSFGIISKLLVLFNLIIGGALFLISLLFAYIGAKRVSKPIQELIHLTTEKVYYEMNDEIELDSNADILQLSNHFNKLFKTTELVKRQSDQQQVKLIELLKQEKQNQLVVTKLIQDLSNEIIEPVQRLSQDLKLGHHEAAKTELVSLNNLINEFDLIRSLKQTAQQERFDKFNIKFLMNKVIVDCESLLKQKNVIIQLNLESLDVIGKRSYIYHVIRNLLLTAISYANHDNFINVTALQQEGIYKIEFQILGISVIEQTLQMMYEPVNPFWDVSSHLNFLSLYVVRLILEKHHQKFGVYNAKEGLVLYFTLELPSSFGYIE